MLRYFLLIVVCLCITSSVLAQQTTPSDDYKAVIEKHLLIVQNERERWQREAAGFLVRAENAEQKIQVLQAQIKELQSKSSECESK